MRLAHTAARREHMQRRARERFGLEVGKVTRRALIRKVQTGEVKLARKLTCSRTLVVAEHAGMEVTFIYSGTAKSIVTFLPSDSSEAGSCSGVPVELL